MPRDPIHTLPSGYIETKFIRLTENRLLVWLNVLSVIPIIVMLGVMGVWWVVVSWGRAAEPSPSIPWWLGLVVAIGIVLPLHELLHGVTIMFFGQRVRYGANLSKGVLYATADQALFRRNEYLVVALAPIVGITLLAMLLMGLVPQSVAYYIGIGAVLNAGGAIGDLWSVGVLLRYPASVLVRDEADGFRIYALGSSTQNTDPPASG